MTARKNIQPKVVKESKSNSKSSGDFDVNALHKEAMLRLSRVVQEQKKDSKNHLQTTFEIDVKKSYELSLPFCKTEEQKAHLESVLSAGPGHFA